MGAGSRDCGTDGLGGSTAGALREGEEPRRTWNSYKVAS